MNEKIKELPLDQINYFLLNEIEAMQILDMEEPKEIDGKYISGLLHQKFPEATIVLTLGSEGSVCISGDEYVEQSIYKVKTVDTTAAGDTYTGYFIAGILNGKMIKEAMDTASKASAIAVSRQGAAPSIPCLEEVEEYKKLEEMKADFLRYHIEDLLSFLFENKINEKIKNISTHHLTVLIMSVILRIEQKINGYLNIDKYPFVKEERV